MPEPASASKLGDEYATDVQGFGFPDGFPFDGLTSSLAKALAGRVVDVDSSVVMDSKVVVEVHDRLASAVQEVGDGRTRKASSIQGKVQSVLDDLSGALDATVEELRRWAAMANEQPVPDLPPQAIDLLAEHALEVLEGERLDRRIAALEQDLAVVRGGVA